VLDVALNTIIVKIHVTMREEISTVFTSVYFMNMNNTSNIEM